MTKSEALPEPLPCPCGRAPFVCEDDAYGGCGVGCSCDAEPYIQREVGHLADAIEAWNRWLESRGSVTVRKARPIELDWELSG